VPLLLVALAFAGIGGAIALNLKPSAAPAIVSRFPFTLPEGQQFTGTGRQIVSISPDGAQFVYVANSRLYLKPMRELQSIYIQGTEITQGGVLNPVFSPDGRSIAFWSGSDQMLKRIAVSGGAPVTICKTEAPFGISWGPNNQIFIGQGPKGIMRVSANGGLPETIVTVKSDELAHGPQVLPGGGAVLFTLLRPGAATNTAERWDKGQIVVQSLESGERKTLIEGGRDARYLPTGHIIYALAGTLLAVPFDIKRLEVITGPVPLVEGVYTAGGITGTAHFSFSDSGSLVYVPQPAPALSGSQMAFVDRNGGVKTLDLPSARYTTGPKVSPNGRQLAFSINDGKEENVWVYELSGGSSMRRLTFGGGRDPVWSGDGERITYGSGGGISWQRADGTGTAEQLYKPEGANAVLGSWNSQNQTLAFGTIRNNERDVWTYSLQDKNAAPLIAIRSSAQNNAFFSPDGRWIAYQSNETGSFEVYVQPFPNTGAKFQITRDGGGHPLWSPDGKELFYERAGRLMSVAIRVQPAFAFGSPVTLPIMGFVQDPGNTPRLYDITKDGKQFIMLFRAGQTTRGITSTQIQVVLNWFSELQQRVPTSN
jgi:serine/threonine-protein kinase